MQGLCMILEAAAEEGSVILEPQLETILNSLHAQVYKYERIFFFFFFFFFDFDVCVV